MLVRWAYCAPPILTHGTRVIIPTGGWEGGVLMGVRNVRRQELRRLEAKTLDARFLTEIQQGLNCSPSDKMTLAVAGDHSFLLRQCVKQGAVGRA